jgi:hypothetical protein
MRTGARALTMNIRAVANSEDHDGPLRAEDVVNHPVVNEPVSP